MKITIKKITSKEVQTQYGLKTKFGFYDGKDWYSAFKGPWNESWREGDTIEVDVKSREYNGKTYYDIIKPDPLKDILKRLAILEQKILTPTTSNKQQTISYDEPPALDDDDFPF